MNMFILIRIIAGLSFTIGRWIDWLRGIFYSQRSPRRVVFYLYRRCPYGLLDALATKLHSVSQEQVSSLAAE